MITLKNSDEKVFYEVYVEAHTNCLYADWTGFVNVNNVKAGCLVALDLIKENNCPYIINDNTNLVGPWQQANQWIQEFWMPQAIEAGLRYMAHITSPDIFGKLSAQDLEKKAAGIFIMRLFKNKEQAEEWIKECQKKDDDTFKTNI
ncbi:hypothetical protein [Bernardetia sp. MNP-M8]|uniref:hypothetical protein n=1 Tax=Bernardetia sp. MNP-M8 TaxID=3127470 RepID=UPI0030D5BB40